MKPLEALNHSSQLGRERVHFEMLNVQTKPPTGQVYSYRLSELYIMCDALNCLSVVYVRNTMNYI